MLPSAATTGIGSPPTLAARNRPAPANRSRLRPLAAKTTNSGTARRAAVSQSGDRLLPHPHLPRRNALSLIGHGARRTAAVFLTKWMSLNRLPSVATNGVGTLTTLAAGNRLRPHPNLAAMTTSSGTKRRAAVSPSVGHRLLHPRLLINSALLLTGPGARNTAAASLINRT
jgi:hypothetical protein